MSNFLKSGSIVSTFKIKKEFREITWRTIPSAAGYMCKEVGTGHPFNEMSRICKKVSFFSFIPVLHEVKVQIGLTSVNKNFIYVFKS
jgi:hypothetical protein